MNFHDDRPVGPGGADPRDPAAAPLDAPVLAALRELYSPPGGEAYWDELEQRVMARVFGRTSAEWWQVMSDWSRTVAMVAAVAIIVATALLVTVEQRVPDSAFAAYEAVVEEPLAFSFEVESPEYRGRVNERTPASVLPH